MWSVSSPARFCLASHRAHFLLHSVWRPSSEGEGSEKTGRNKSEGGERRAGSEEGKKKKKKSETKASRGKKRLLKKNEWAWRRKGNCEKEIERTRDKGRQWETFSCVALKLFVVFGLLFKHTSGFKRLTPAVIFTAAPRYWDSVKKGRNQNVNFTALFIVKHTHRHKHSRRDWFPDSRTTASPYANTDHKIWCRHAVLGLETKTKARESAPRRSVCFSTKKLSKPLLQGIRSSIDL